MALVLVGINHTTANIALREKVAFPPETVAPALNQLNETPGIDEAVIVSTCNRTEIYLNFADAESAAGQIEPPATQLAENRALLDRQLQLVDWMAGFHALEADELKSCSYSFADEDVVRHLMKVACGLDSMIMGEPQILGQIKSAFAVSQDLNVVGPGLGRAFQAAFSIAKEVRTDTAIGQNPVSVAYAAATLAQRLFSRMDELNVMLIGAGRTVELVARHLTDKGVKDFVVANRTLGNAMEVAKRINAKGVLLSEIPLHLMAADIVISATNRQLPLLGKGAVEKALKQRKHKPMLLIDLAVPRDIEPEVAELDDAYLYSVDDISEVIEDSVKSRADAAAQAQTIIDRGVEEYLRHVRSLNAVATLTAFRRKADQIRAAELQRAVKALEKGESPKAALENLARSLTKKLLHSPSVQLKQATAEGRDEILRLTQELYELDQDLNGEEN